MVGGAQPQPPAPPSTNNTLLGLAVTSPNDAWAVGTSSTGTADHTLILHWNGTSCTLALWRHKTMAATMQFLDDATRQ